jgi:hypothetical protein
MLRAFVQRHEPTAIAGAAPFAAAHSVKLQVALDSMKDMTNVRLKFVSEMEYFSVCSALLRNAMSLPQ